MIALCKSFYPIFVIQKAIEDFKGICTITIFETKNYYELSFYIKDEKENSSIIEKEFCNYCLSIAR